MRLRATAFLLLLLSGVMAGAATHQASRPSTRPATRPADPATAAAGEPAGEPVALGWVVERVANLNTTPKVVAPGPGVDLAGALIFPGHSLEAGTELWRSDGTPGGTRLLKDISPGPAGSIPTDLTVFNGRVYFIAGH